jgi:ABC-2 type transport system permease protein
MSADTLAGPEPARHERPSPKVARPSLTRLTLLEMRKLVDTRSGFWLLVAIVLGDLAIAVVVLIWGGGSQRSLAGYFSPSLLPVNVLLPVLGILTFTTEWSQRTALTTFTLVPQRQRIVVAKLAAAITFAAASVVVSVTFAALGNLLSILFDRGDGRWDLTWSIVAQGALLQVLSVVQGVAFGMVLTSSALAIVLYFVLPIVWSILNAGSTRIHGVTGWLDVNGAMSPLMDGDIHGSQWVKLLASSLLWLAVPLLLGTVFTLRREVK